MNVVILGGGNSPEREVSLRSAASVAEGAKKAGFSVTQLDPIDGFGIFDSVTSGSIVLPILHGEGGEDGVLQAELEKRNIPFLGSGSESSAKSFDKWQTRLELEKSGLPVAKGALITKDIYRQNPLSDKPHVLKILHGGSSIGTMIVRNPQTIDEIQVQEIFEMESTVLIEELVEGIEATVSILDQKALTVIEIIPPEGDEFDYENKYNGKTQELCPPLSIPENIQKQCQQMAEKAHQAMGCRHLSRVDIMIGHDQRLGILEINTIPGLTDQSLFPKSAAVDGMDMPQLVSRFVELVKRDYSLT